MLDIESVSMRFLGLTALDQVSFSVAQGSVHALIGPNGAGKTTLFNIISGVQKPSAGRVHLAPHGDLGAVPLHQRCSRGIARTFQNIRLFGALTVLENVLLGMSARLAVPTWKAMLGLRASVAEEGQAVRQARALLHKVGLGGQELALAASLPYGAQRRLELARALACEPVLLLLDEPAAGMNDREREDLARLIEEIRHPGLAILIVEHDVSFVMRLSDRITVLNFGALIADGLPAQVRSHPEVRRAYLGEETT